jgi:hypothetical protein
MTMNTKAATAATNAPTAKDENKNTASAGTAPTGKIKFVPLTEAEEKLYEDLKKDFDNLDDKGEARLSELKKKVKAADSAKAQYVLQLKTELTTAALAVKDLFTKDDVLNSFSITELFSQTEIDAVATKRASGKAGKGATGNTGGKKSTARASDDDIELFHFPKTGAPRDRDFLLQRGRINERYNDTVATPFIVNEANFPKKLLAHGTSEKELLKYISKKDGAKAEEYLNTPEGKDEMARIVEVVSKANAKLNPSGAGTEKQAA